MDDNLVSPKKNNKSPQKKQENITAMEMAVSNSSMSTTSGVRPRMKVPLPK